MKDSRLTKLINGIPETEYNIVLKILSHYNVDIIDISKVRTVYKINTSQGIKCLKRLKSKKSSAEKTYYLTQYLLNRDFNNIANFVTTTDNKLYVKYNDFYFYMTDWIQGRECDFNDFNELLNAIRVLAKFHIAASGKDGEKYFKVDSNLKNLPSIFMEHCEKLMHYKKVIDRKRIKSEFDKKYRQYIDNFYMQGLAAVDLLNKSNYYGLSKVAKSERSICHNSFYYQNLIIDDKNNIYIIDLDSTVRDIRMHDLGKFIRRILYKKAYTWNFDTTKKIIDEYSSITPISKEEIEVLLSIIIFPHKFCKLGKKKYEKQKLWNDEKYLKKLEKQIKYLPYKEEFIKKFIEYYGININLNRYF